MSLVVQSVAKAFGRFPALGGVSLEVKDGEFLALLGPSGSGKTTLLRILAGLEVPDSGTVTLGGENFLALSARDRRIGMVFQHYALFRHMTVAQNIAFGLTVRPRKERPGRAAIAARVNDLLRLIQLEDLGGRYPAQLSGGQRQRVALARALAIEPRMLLLDEPFGALDAKVRRELRRWLRQVHDETGVTTIFVTHDQEEALDLADRVAILKDGQLIQVGESQAVYARPATGFVFDFLGNAVRLSGETRDGALVLDDWLLASNEAIAGQGMDLYFRSDEARILPAGDLGIRARVDAVSTRGPTARLELSAQDVSFELQLPAAEVPDFVRTGEVVRVLPTQPRLFPSGR